MAENKAYDELQKRFKEIGKRFQEMQESIKPCSEFVKAFERSQLHLSKVIETAELSNRQLSSLGEKVKGFEIRLPDVKKSLADVSQLSDSLKDLASSPLLKLGETLKTSLGDISSLGEKVKGFEIRLPDVKKSLADVSQLSDSLKDLDSSPLLKLGETLKTSLGDISSLGEKVKGFEIRLPDVKKSLAGVSQLSDSLKDLDSSPLLKLGETLKTSLGDISSLGEKVKGFEIRLPDVKKSLADVSQLKDLASSSFPELISISEKARGSISDFIGCTKRFDESISDMRKLFSDLPKLSEEINAFEKYYNINEDIIKEYTQSQSSDKSMRETEANYNVKGENENSSPKVINDLAQSLIVGPVNQLYEVLEELKEQTDYSDISESMKKLSKIFLHLSDVRQVLEKVSEVLEKELEV